MGTNKGKPQAGNLGRGRYGAICQGPPLDAALSGVSQTDPTVFIVPQLGATCQGLQQRMICQKMDVLALLDDVLKRWQQARAAWLSGGDPQDYLAAQALADDRRALLAEIGGES